MALTARPKKKVQEKPLPHSRDYDGNPVDLEHLHGYQPMKITEIHASERDQGFAIVMQDEVGNNRVGRISMEQLRLTLREIGWDVKSY